MSPVRATSEPEVLPGSGRRADLTVVGMVALLLALAVGLGVYFNRPGSGVELWANAAPLYADWLVHAGPGTAFAVLIAVAVVVWGQALSARLRLRALLGLGYLAAVAWTFSLAMVDGWDRGFAAGLEHHTTYLSEVGGITDIPAMLAGFVERIPVFSEGAWTVHVAGHPPGATLVFVWMDRLGLSGGAWAATACVLAGALAAVTVPATLAVLGRPEQARTIVPFAVLFPGAVWIGVSADGLFACVTAVGIFLLACAGRAFRTGSRYAIPAALGAGVLLGFGIFLSYGLVLLGVLALAVALLTRSWVTLVLAVVGALAVVAVFALYGFWWFDGYQAVVQRYYQGIASERPYWYWVWANLAALALALGPAALAGARRSVAALLGWAPRAAVRWEPAAVLAGAALLAILVADISGLSKAEVERIWLPFAVWLPAATALLPAPSRRWWLAAQAATALAVNHLVLTVW